MSNMQALGRLILTLIAIAIGVTIVQVIGAIFGTQGLLVLGAIAVVGLFFSIKGGHNG